jgi:hypothetical protein
METAVRQPTQGPRTRSNRFTEDQDAVIEQFLQDKNRRYAWLLDVAIRAYLASEGYDFPEKYGVRPPVKVA